MGLELSPWALFTLLPSHPSYKMFHSKISSDSIALRETSIGIPHALTRDSTSLDDGILITQDIAEYGMSVVDSFPPSRQMSEAEQGRSEAVMALPPIDRGRGAWWVTSCIWASQV